MEKILAYAPVKGTALRAADETSSHYRVVYSRAQLERELRTSSPSFVLGDRASSEELVRLVGDRATVVAVDANSPEQVRQAGVRLLAVQPNPTSGKASRAYPPGSGVKALHDSRTGRLHAVRIARWLGVSLNQFARFLGRAVQTIHKTPAGVGLQESLTVYERIAASLLSLFGTRARALVWLNAPHPDLDQATPMSLLAKRKSDVVAAMLEDALLGQPG